MSLLLQKSASTMRRVSVGRRHTETAVSRVRQYPSSGVVVSSLQVDSVRTKSSTPAATSRASVASSCYKYIRGFHHQNRAWITDTSNSTTSTSACRLAHTRKFSSDNSNEKKEEKKNESDSVDTPPPPQAEVKTEKKENEPKSDKLKEKTEEKKEKELKKEEASSDDVNPTSKQEISAADDEVPIWQNPLHHNNLEKQKNFEEDFPSGQMPVQELPPFEDPNDPEKVLASKEIYDLADEVLNLSMLEMNELVNKIADHFGFEKPPFTGSDGAGGGGDDGDGDEEGGPAPAPVEEKKAFDLKLVSYDDKAKIKVIKEVRAIAGLGLKEAKEVVEGAPKVVMKDIGKEAAEEMKKKLEEVGAVIEIV